jgi:hypothetical protein
VTALTLCEDIARFATGLRLADVPERVVERVRLQADNIEAAAALGEGVARPFRAAAPDGPLGEVYLGAVASIASDWDDYLLAGHTGHSSVWAARAFAGGDDERALTAQLAANEVAGRLGLALFLGPHNGQFWSSIHCASGAVAAGLGLGLDADRLAHAVAIALSQPPYGLWPGFMGPASKLLTAADPAVQGARAALLAAEGVDGPLGVIEDRRGLLTHFAFHGRLSMIGAWGQVWLSDTLAFKPHPGCAYLQAAVDAALRADVAAAEVAAIDVDGGWLTCGMEVLSTGSDLAPVRVNFSTALSVAVALIAGRLTEEELTPAWLAAHEAEVRDLASRVRLRHDWELTAQTIGGTVNAGLGLRDVPPAAWLRVRRRMRELHMDDLPAGWRDLRELLGDGSARAARRAALAPGRDRVGSSGLAGLDTSRVRMTFPCRLRVRLRSGRTLEIEGDERGSCGRPLSEQREVVEAKRALARLG